MSVKPLKSKTIRQINLSLNTQFFPVTLKSLVVEPKSHFAEVKALTKISFLGESFGTITEPRELRTSTLLPSMETDLCIVIVKFDVFFSSLEQYENYVEINGINGDDAANAFNYVIAENERDISNLPIPRLLVDVHPLELSLCVEFSQQNALASEDSIEFARSMIELQAVELSKEIQENIFKWPFEQIEHLMYACAEKFDDAFERLAEEHGIELPFHDLHFGEFDSQDTLLLMLYEAKQLPWGNIQISFSEVIEDETITDDCETPEPENESQENTACLSSPILAAPSQYQYSSIALRIVRGIDTLDLPLTLLEFDFNKTDQYIHTLHELSLESFYFSKCVADDGEHYIFKNNRFTPIHMLVYERIFKPAFILELLEFLRQSLFLIVIIGPPAACNLVGRTCQSVLSPRLRERVLFSRNVERRVECNAGFSKDLIRCECGRINHVNYIYHGASVECVAGIDGSPDVINYNSATSFYVVDLCDLRIPFKIIAHDKIKRPILQEKSTTTTLTKECMRNQVQIAKDELALDWKVQQPEKCRVGCFTFRFVQLPMEHNEFVTWEARERLAAKLW